MEKNKLNAITLSGKIGAGKSTTAKILVDKLGYEYIHSGLFFRKYAEDNGLTFTKLHELLPQNPRIDLDIDEMQKEMLSKKNNFILDSRIGFYLVPNAFHVFLDLSENTAAKRVLKDIGENPNRKIERADTVEEVIKNMRNRYESESEKFKRLYGIENHFDPKHFNFVINTEKLPPEEVAEAILEEFQKWQKQL